jgi:predicted AAA+ superfamily ATPase
MFLDRNYPRIAKLVRAHRSVRVFGPRGSGKTFFLSRIIADYQPHLTVDLLDKVEFERVLRHPERLTQEIESRLQRASDPLLVFIDEVQRLPSLLDEVHRLIERHKPRLFFVLTSSSARKLKDVEANLLAGRALRENFFPLGIEEVPEHTSFDSLLQFGTLPEVITEIDDELKLRYLRTYVGTYLQEEIQRESRVRNLEGFARFLEVAASESGSITNYQKIGRAAAVVDTTVKSYFQLLCDTLIAYQIPAWSYSVRKQIQTASRYYLFDNGVINALAGELQTEIRPATNRYGRLFESFVVQQITQRLAKELSPLRMYHYRESGGLEVDLILQKNPHSPPLAIEIKSSPAPSPREVKSLSSFKAYHPSAKLMVICRTPRRHEDGECLFVNLLEGLEEIIAFGRA